MGTMPTHRLPKGFTARHLLRWDHTQPVGLGRPAILQAPCRGRRGRVRTLLQLVALAGAGGLFHNVAVGVLMHMGRVHLSYSAGNILLTPNGSTIFLFALAALSVTLPPVTFTVPYSLNPSPPVLLPAPPTATRLRRRPLHLAHRSRRSVRFHPVLSQCRRLCSSKASGGHIHPRIYISAGGFHRSASNRSLNTAHSNHKIIAADSVASFQKTA